MKLIKIIKIVFFNLIYGRISKVQTKKNNQNITIKKVSFKKKYFYNVYFSKNSRNYVGSIHDSALIINNSVFPQASYQYRYNRYNLIQNADVKKNIVFTEGTARFKKEILGSVFMLLTGGAGKENYFHWIFDVLPRIAILEKSNFNFKNLKFLLPSLKFNFQKETLKLLKLPPKNCLDIKYYKHFTAEKIITTDHPYVFNNNPTNSILDIPPWIIFWLRKKFKFRNKKKNIFSSKIYIDRSDSKFSKNRYIVNEENLKKYLITKGFKSVVLSKISFKKQVKIFSHAKVIVGAHGAGFSNIIFSNPGTKIIELQSSKSGDAIKNLAKKCNLNYKRIVSKYIFKKNMNPHGKILVDLNLLKKKLN